MSITNDSVETNGAVHDEDDDETEVVDSAVEDLLAGVSQAASTVLATHPTMPAELSGAPVEPAARRAALAEQARTQPAVVRRAGEVDEVPEGTRTHKIKARRVLYIAGAVLAVIILFLVLKPKATTVNVFGNTAGGPTATTAVGGGTPTGGTPAVPFDLLPKDVNIGHNPLRQGANRIIGGQIENLRQVLAQQLSVNPTLDACKLWVGPSNTTVEGWQLAGTNTTPDYVKLALCPDDPDAPPVATTAPAGHS